MPVPRRSPPLLDLLLFLLAIVVASTFCYWILSLLLPNALPRRHPPSYKPSAQDGALWGSLQRMRLWQQHYYLLFGIPMNATESRLESLLVHSNLTLRETLTLEPVVLQLRQWQRLQNMVDKMPLWIENGMNNLAKASHAQTKQRVNGKQDDGMLRERFKIIQKHFDVVASDLQLAILGIQPLSTQCHQRMEENFLTSSEDGVVHIVDTRLNKPDNASWIQSVKQDIGELVRKIEASDGDTFKMLQKGGTAHMETVIQLPADSTLLDLNSTHSVVMQIIDTHNNRFVLARPANLAHLGEDSKLLYEILMLTVAAVMAGAAAEWLGLPSFLGHLAAGTVLGPSWMNQVQNLVQMNTLGQLGLIFIVLSLGLHLSLDTMKAVWKTSLLLVSLLTIISMAGCVMAGRLIFDMSFGQSVFIGSILSLSSTAVAIKCLERGDANAIQTPTGQLILGLLISQDVLFCVALALLPHLRGSLGVIRLLVALGGLCFGTATYALLVMALIKATRRYCSSLWMRITPLGLIGLILFMTLLGQRLGVSLELGCFIAAVIVGSFPECLADHSSSHLLVNHSNSNSNSNSNSTPIPIPSPEDRLRSLISTLSDALSILFFISVGLAIDVRFLWGEKFLLLPLTLGICVIKAGVISTLARLVGCKGHVAALVGVNLGQVSELALVLGTRGRQLGLVSAESYYMVAGVTALGMIVTPVFWFLLACYEGRHVKS